ncbi:sensor histidine kinase [Tropicibacter naphthalenivorans]|uniref:histidine kinase n=1 Tax=Tropicibacter naphthalenivorans TaxID=441103 RepID=A0A0P1G779_9RHOB|nr:hybrid sensor histidine kinase/response regulator [Tropicibacter naphthalenivorans]CUH77396.1 Phytochrome-like protein cph1 [Tropicibacter naphthalenivorans]SMC58285.1 hypothetical protein SAMN04488093_102161 [Tropicibacter naphthalenivorans]
MQDLTVLIVDDDKGDRELIKRLLRKTEFACINHEASSTEASFALDLAHVDAIFLDYLLPGDTGLGHLKDYRKRWPQAAIFFMTGQGDEGIAKTAIKFGATDYIPKSAINQQSVNRMMKNGLAQALAQWRLDELIEDLTQFSEVLVHDLNAPVRATAFLCEQIQEDVQDKNYEGVVDGARLLRKTASQMQEMIRSLGDHVRLDREVELNETTADALVDKAMTLLEQEIKERNAVITRQFDLGNTPIYCRPPQITQVLQNLIANAMKYSGERTPEIHITVRCDADHHIIFDVADNGIGVPPDFRKKIFEPFKRAPGANQQAGTGLGLATCRKIVGRHGGTIKCDSVVGEGTTISFKLPAVPQHSRTAPVAR